MKTLNIESPVGQRLAQIALFERLQSYFNLHPTKIADDIRSYAKRHKEDPLEIVENLFQEAPKWLETILRAVALKANGEETLELHEVRLVTRDSFALSVCDRLEWYPNVILKDVRSKAKEEGFTAFEFADYLVTEMPDVVRWTLYNAERILKQDKE
jgi:hypothetical protein